MSFKFSALMTETQCQQCPEEGYCRECSIGIFNRWIRTSDEILEIRALLAKERDEFGRRESELMVKLGKSERALAGKDALIFGEGHLQDGKRIDPSEIYKTEEVLKLEASLKKSLELGDRLHKALNGCRKLTMGPSFETQDRIMVDLCIADTDWRIFRKEIGV